MGLEDSPQSGNRHPNGITRINFDSFSILDPSAFRRKLPGLFIGTLVLLAVNLVRIVSLFLTGVYYPKAFDAMHADVWQILFILLAIVFWALWVQWASRRPAPAPVATAAG